MSEIQDIHEKLRSIKVNLVKLNIGKRTQTLLKQKYLDAKDLYEKYILSRDKLNVSIGKGHFKQEEVESVLVICEEIEAFYQKIKDFCLTSKHDICTMAEFDIKTASSLLPIMTGEEEVTKKLIDCTEFYSQNLKKDHEQLLISFILKTRLSESAKLRIGTNYKTCTELIADMKTHLLSKQSATALQLEMVKARQGSQNIEEFGKKLEDLFVKLTISQADGNSSTFDVLRPINEKLAIQRFTEGLRNSRLSTVLAARNYSALKDAIRAAKDEECSQQGPSTSVETIFSSQHRRRGRGTYNVRMQNHRYSQATGNQPIFRSYSRINSNRGYTQTFRGRGRSFRYNNNRGNNNYTRGSRGRNAYMLNRQENTMEDTSRNVQNSKPSVEFFRE